MIYRIFLKLLFLIGIVTSMDIKTEQFKMLDKIKSLFPNNTYNKAHFNKYAKDIKTTVDLFKDTVTHADKDKVVQRYQFPNQL